MNPGALVALSILLVGAVAFVFLAYIASHGL